MHLFSHLVIAQALLPACQPGDLAEYFWGAVAPDIRYLLGMRRRATHVSLDTLRAWDERWPELRDFILGYRVHLLTDERDGAGALYARLPLPFVRRRMPRPPAAVLLEAAYFERQRMEVCISGAYNPILAELGISEKVAAFYAASARRYAQAPSYAEAMSVLAEISRTSSLGGPLGNAAGALPGKLARLERYLRIIRWLERHPRFQRWIIDRVDVDGVTGRVAADLRKNLQANER